MAVKVILESVEELDESLKGEYTKKKIGDKEVYVLDVEGVQSHPDVTALKSALDRQKSENKTLKTEKAELEGKVTELPEDFTLDEWTRLQALDIDPNDPEKDKKRKEKEDERLANARRQYEQQIDALKKKYDTDMAEAQNTITTERTGRASDRADTQLTEALTKAGVKPALIRAAKAVHKGAIRSDAEDGELRVFVETDLGEQSIDAFIEAWAKSDEGKEFIAPASGGDAGGTKRATQSNGENNPFAAATWNRSAQATLAQTDRVKAERLAKSAGFGTLELAIKAVRANTAK